MDLNIYPPLPRRKDFRIGILGSGFIVNDCHLVAYRKAGFNPVAIASRTVENAIRVANRHGIPTAYENYEQLLNNPEIEVLDIAVPPNAQIELIKAACARKTVKGILAQKPLGMNYAEAVEAVTACETAGITLAVNQNMRYDQSVRAAKTLLENGTLGEPVFATIEMRGIPHWMPWQKDLGWLTLRIMSIHHLDTFRYWFGDAEAIYCSVRSDPRTKFPHTDGICTYILEYKDGLRCVGLDDTWTGPAKEGCPSDIYIKWRIEGLNGLAIGDIGWCREPYTTPSTIRFAPKGQKEFERPVWTESWFPDAFVGTMAQLLIALEDGSQPTISGKDNLKTMALVEAAYLSAAKGLSIPLSAVERKPGFQVVHTATPVSKEAKIAERSRGGAVWLKERKRPGLLRQFLSSFELIFRDEPAECKKASHDFTTEAQEAFTVAREEAENLNQQFVGTEHLLLGITRLNHSVAFAVLKQMGHDVEEIRKEVLRHTAGPNPNKNSADGILHTPRVKKVLALAIKEAKWLGHAHVGTEHILLGFLKEGDGIAGRVLSKLGVKLEPARKQILKNLDQNFKS